MYLFHSVGLLVVGAAFTAIPVPVAVVAAVCVSIVVVVVVGVLDVVAVVVVVVDVGDGVFDEKADLIMDLDDNDIVLRNDDVFSVAVSLGVVLSWLLLLLLLLFVIR